ncbi:MAG: SAM-dependent DNA methyltransferase [Oscillibacter sp.]|nr:SAM-dependent DNA methyltransferase [Oscillibacter sp.]
MITDINALQQDIRAIGSVSDSAEFFEGFLRAFDIPVSTIDRLKSTSSYNVNKGVRIGQQLFYLASEGSNLYSDFNILKKNNIASLKTRFAMIANAVEVLVFDLKTEETLFSSKAELFSHVDFFFPLIGREKPVIEENIAVNIEVSEKFAQLYNECRLNNTQADLTDISELICRTLFCCVIDSMGVLMTGDTSLYVFAQKYTEESGRDFSGFISSLFLAMKMENRSNLPLYFKQVNYIDSRLFDRDISGITFTRNMRSLMLEIMSFDWSNVDPEILGSLIQSIIVPDDENITGNFTATANVQKVIGPLFLNSLYSEYENCKNESTACNALKERVMKLCVFDTSCGCGNFLLVTYKELNLLLAKIASAAEQSIPLMPITNFYGIESNPFSCAIARMGLLFVVLQSKKTSLATLQADIDVLFNNNIVTGNPTRISWDSVCPGASETYIIGNPSYKGARKRNDEQNADMDYVFNGYSNYKNLDYAACWFLLAAKYIQTHGGAYAFVTTNSLTQGEQVSLLWPKLFECGVHIRFGHKAFKWRNDARNTTAVTVVIIGIVSNSDTRRCELYSQTVMTEPTQISPYLTPGSTLVQKRKRPISSLPYMIKGNMPYDGGYLLMDVATKNHIVEQDRRVLQYMRRIVGSDEFINGIERWCFWITDDKADAALEIPIIKERADLVRDLRLGKTDKSAQRLAAYPYRFREMHETTTNSLVIPSVSSENREYVPVGFVDKKTVVTNLAFVIYDCDPWIFGVVSSKMHNLWIKAVCGGLETRIRYSSELGYNTFPFPSITDEQKKDIRNCVNQVIAVREEEFDKTYAQMYKKDEMSDDLRFAHSMLDLQIERCYRDEPFVSDDERLDCLFELYEKIGG